MKLGVRGRVGKRCLVYLTEQNNYDQSNEKREFFNALIRRRDLRNRADVYKNLFRRLAYVPLRGIRVMKWSVGLVLIVK